MTLIELINDDKIYDRPTSTDEPKNKCRRRLDKRPEISDQVTLNDGFNQLQIVNVLLLLDSNRRDVACNVSTDGRANDTIFPFCN